VGFCGVRLVAVGPRQQGELAGRDAHLPAGNRRYPALCAADGHGPLLHRMVDEGQLGMKSRIGFWTYSEEQVARVCGTLERAIANQRVRVA